MCDFSQYPRDQPCGAELMKKVTYSDGSYKFEALHTYAYRPIIASLQNLLQRHDFEEECEEWRTRDVDDEVLADRMDGKVWTDFQTVNGKDFLAAPNNYALTLNFDFFQPYKHRSDGSVGVFYLVVDNLPRKYITTGSDAIYICKRSQVPQYFPKAFCG